jgi:hypothetical protein
MSIQSSSANCSISPAQVWARLATELQERAIRLMAQLAFNLVAAQSEWPDVKNKESNHVNLPHQSQNSA